MFYSLIAVNKNSCFNKSTPVQLHLSELHNIFCHSSESVL